MLKLRTIKLLKVASGVFTAVGMAFYLWIVNAPRAMELIAEEDILIYQTESDALRSEKDLHISVLKKGQHARVAHCYYTKNYQFVVIRLPNERTGFLLDGRYLLMRNKKKVVC